MAFEVFNFRRIVLGLLLSTLLACAASAGPVGAVDVPDPSLPGAFRASFPEGWEIHLRDVFAVQRGGKDLGRAVVVRVQGGAITVAARPGFNGTMKPGDQLRYLYREPAVPSQVTTRLRLATGDVEIMGQPPGKHSGTFQVRILVHNPGAFRARRVRVRCEMVDFFGRIVLSDTAKLPDLAPNARARAVLFTRRRDVSLVSSIGDRATISVGRGRVARQHDVQARFVVDATP